MSRSRIGRRIFGYRLFNFKPEDLPGVATIALRSGISADIDPSGVVTVGEGERGRFCALVDGRFEYSETIPLGVRGFLYRNRKRYGVFLGGIFFIFLIIFSSGRVWDVRVSGAERYSETEILDELSSCGLSVGDSWRRLNTSEIENKLLSYSERISWININRRGTVAYVDVVEKHKVAEVLPDYECASIVASVDCVIEDITVKRGHAVVKRGDAVKRGDVLISGIIPSELGGGFCVAEGSVVGRASDSVSVEIPRNHTVSVPVSQKTVGLTLKILNFSINILNNYGNSYTGCDIIDSKRDVWLFGKWRLPVCVERKVAVFSSSHSETLSDSRLVLDARECMESALDERLMDVQLIEISTVGYFTDTGYTMISRIVYDVNVGYTVPISTDQPIKSGE